MGAPKGRKLTKHTQRFNTIYRMQLQDTTQSYKKINIKKKYQIFLNDFKLDLEVFTKTALKVQAHRCNVLINFISIKYYKCNKNLKQLKDKQCIQLWNNTIYKAKKSVYLFKYIIKLQKYIAIVPTIKVNKFKQIFKNIQFFIKKTYKKKNKLNNNFNLDLLIKQSQLLK